MKTRNLDIVYILYVYCSVHRTANGMARRLCIFIDRTADTTIVPVELLNKHCVVAGKRLGYKRIGRFFAVRLKKNVISSRGYPRRRRLPRSRYAQGRILTERLLRNEHFFSKTYVKLYIYTHIIHISAGNYSNISKL